MSGPLSEKSVTAKVGRSPRWHGRIPASVLLDTSISSDAVRVYGFLSLDVYQSNLARVGLRVMGRVLGLSRTTVNRRVTELISAGHIRKAPAKSGQRGCYELQSPVFGQKQGKVTELVSAPSGGIRFASIAKEEIA